jgi:anti-sigma28 factor (negative regulator of flagellin synthesis)
MKIHSGDVPDTMEIQIDQARQSREVTDSTGPTTGSKAGTGSSDSIALTGVSDVVQLALNAGTNERADRVQQLKQLVDSNQYATDPAALSRAMIGAQLTGD